MNKRMIFFVTGQIVGTEALFLLLSAAVSLYYSETPAAISLLISAAVSALIFISTIFFKPKEKDRMIFAKDGFVIVALSWIVMSAIGALPFYISREIPLYVDAFFETVSGFTTTGASILTNVENISNGLLFWRSFTHWVGGMGVLVFVMAIIPIAKGRSIHLMRAEMPGPIVGKLVPKVRQTAKILYLIYVVMTFILVLFLVGGGMSVFDSLLHAFGTAGTGGFGIKADSIASYSPYLQWVLGVGMLVFGINFNLYYLILAGRGKTALKSGELWTYLGVVGISTALITINIFSMYDNFETSLRHGFFQVSSIITTTGFVTTDFNLWNGFSKAILFIIMFIGGCAGSTAGGLKVSRVCLLFKMIRNNFRHMLHPRSVECVNFEGKKVDNETLNGVSVYFAIYFVCLSALFLLVSLDKFDFETNLTAVVTCFNNVGPGFGAVGPASNFAGYNSFSTFVLSIAMLLGRLEIFPLLIMFSALGSRKK